MTEITAILDPAEDMKVTEAIFTSWIACESLQEVGEANAVFYVAGFIGFSLKRSKAVDCTACQVSMVYKDEGPEPMIDGEAEEGSEDAAHKRRFLDIINRGGLSTPTDQLYITCLYAQSCLDHIKKSPEEWANLLAMPNPGASFVLTFCEKMEESEEVADMVNSDCVFGHKWSDHLPRIAQKMFNIMAQNVVAEKADEIRLNSRKRSSGKLTDVERKVTKLRSNQQ